MALSCLDRGSQMFMSVWGVKIRPLLSSIFDNSWAKHFCDISSDPLQSLYSRPCARPAHMASLGLCMMALLQVLQTVEAWCSCKELKPCLREITTDGFQGKQKLQRVQQYQSTRASVFTGSVPRKMAEGLQWVSALCEHRTRVARLTANCLNH